LLGYVEDGAGNVLSLKEMMKNPSVVHNELFKKIVLELNEKPHIRQHRRFLKAPMPLGEGSYKIFARYGQTLTEMYLHFLAKPLAVLVLSWMFFLILYLATQNSNLRDVVKRFKSS
jgi:hypothetical protein